MFKSFVGPFFSRIRYTFSRNPNAFLRACTGVIHIGANEGQERALYAAFGLPVVWIEPIPNVFEVLEKNISSYPRQKALRYLVAEEDGKEYSFHVASNGGASSSILDFAEHAKIWPEVSFTQTLALSSVTLPTIIRQEGIDISQYSTLILDTQGSELLILRGASTILSKFRYVKLEVADFEAYKGCCNIGDVAKFMANSGFHEKKRKQFAISPSGGAYYDVIYRNRHL